MADVKSSQMLTGPVDAVDPQLNVLPDASPLKPGKYAFTLVVTDDVDQKSAAATWVVEVRNPPDVEISGPSVVAFNQVIPLTAKVSTTGTIKTFTWSVKVG